MKRFFILVFLALNALTYAQRQKFALLNATAHIGNGKVIENSIIVVEKGIIKLVADATTVRIKKDEYDTLYSLPGMHVYPALINLNNVLGLHDAEAVRATRDYQETGNYNPHVRALIAYNTDNLIVPTIRCNGVLYTQVTPRGGIISGQSSIMALDGWNWEDAVVKPDDGIHLNFPKLISVNWSFDEGLISETNKNYSKEMEELKQFMAESKAYAQEKNPVEKNLRFEAMKGVWSGSKNLYIHVEYAKDILEAIHFIQTFNIPKPVLVGATEIGHVLPAYKKFRYPVILNRTHQLPYREDDHLHYVYQLPKMLDSDSILFAISMHGDMEAMNSRNLSYNAGTAAAFGLDKEKALQSISFNAAKIIGMEKHLGTLEENKWASFFVTKGDILDMATSEVVLAFIQGKRIQIRNKQLELYEKYERKYKEGK
ncbi:MAG: amidohydrolase family protein [Bacteroidia bacterium]|nr:amidohydrolase family protein [Bacteroidia bacterium]